MVIVDVSPGDGAVAASASRAAPQLLQKRASSVLLCPHWVQNGIEAASLATRAVVGAGDRGAAGRTDGLVLLARLRPQWDERLTVDLHPRSRSMVVQEPMARPTGSTATARRPA